MLAVARKEVIRMPAELLTKNERAAPRPIPTAPDDEFRAFARTLRKCIERAHGCWLEPRAAA
jgi:hypothetical protein